MDNKIIWQLKYYSDESKKKCLDEVEVLKALVLPGVAVDSIINEDSKTVGVVVRANSAEMKKAKSRNAGRKAIEVEYYPDPLSRENGEEFTYKKYFELAKTMTDLDIIKCLNINKATFYRRKKKMLVDIECMKLQYQDYDAAEDTRWF